MWISYSTDLRHWGSHKLMMEARRGAWWDANKIGLSPPPIETEKGWLVIYHGVRQTAAGAIYRLGLALFDLHTPEHVPEAQQTNGSLGRKSPMSCMVMWATSSFPVATRLPLMAIRSVCITARPTQALPWPRAVFARCWIGLINRRRVRK